MYILILHECLYYGSKLNHSLINPNQLRMAGSQVWDNPFDPNHDLCIECDNDLSIPLRLQGTKTYFESRSPTIRELETCPHIELTSIREWNPNTVNLSIQSTISILSDNSEWSTQRYICDISINNNDNERFSYSQLDSDESILHDIEPSLVRFYELLHDNDTTYPPLIRDDIPARRTYSSTDRHRKLDATSLAEMWGIGIKRASATIQCTTQRGVRSAILPLSRRYRADRMYNLKRLNSKFATDTFYSDIKSLNQNRCAQIFSHKVGFSAVYPMERATGDTIGTSYLNFCHDFGVPEFLTFDGATAQVGKNTLFMRSLKKHQSQFHVSSPRRPNENPAEACIRETKKRWYRIMHRQKVPRRLWDFGLVWICETGNLTSTSSKYADNRTPLEIITGETPDISEYVDFSFYDWVTYRPNAGLGENSLGRWLGISHKVGQLMSYWILTISGNVISCTTVQRVTNLEKQLDEWRDRMSQYDININERLKVNDSDLTSKIVDIDQWNRLSVIDIDEAFIDEFNKVISDTTLPDVDHSIHNIDNVNDPYLQMEIGLSRGDDGALQHATVKRRKLDKDGVPIGTENKNPILDTRLYEVEFVDGTTEAITANVIAENLLAQVDAEGHRQLLLDEIIDHRTTSSAISKSNGFTTSTNGQRRRKLTTRGWELCVIWKDGSTDWVALKDLKESSILLNLHNTALITE